MGDTYPKIRVAVVQAAPVFSEREPSAEKAICFIEEAGQKGVDLLAFPEGFIPCHPVWYHFHPATGKKSLAFAAELFKNSVEIPGSTTEALCAAAARANVNVVMGLCEKRPRTTGTMYNTQLFISRQGKILGKHQKLMPTVGERLVHAGGFGDTLRVIDMDIGRVSGLICGEKLEPSCYLCPGSPGDPDPCGILAEPLFQERAPDGGCLYLCHAVSFLQMQLFCPQRVRNDIGPDAGSSALCG